MTHLQVGKTKPAGIVGSAPRLPSEPGEQMALWLTAAALKLEAWINSEMPEVAIRSPWLGSYRSAAEERSPGISRRSLGGKAVLS